MEVMHLSSASPKGGGDPGMMWGLFTVVGLVTWPMNGREAGVDLVLIETSLLLLCKSSCSYAN